MRRAYASRDACSPPRSPASSPPVVFSSRPLAEPLAAISPLTEPTRPPLIAALQPVGDTNTLAQVQVRFSDDLIPLERLESPDEAALLAHFSLDPSAAWGDFAS